MFNSHGLRESEAVRGSWLALALCSSNETNHSLAAQRVCRIYKRKYGSDDKLWRRNRRKMDWAVWILKSGALARQQPRVRAALPQLDGSLSFYLPIGTGKAIVLGLCIVKDD